jgi:hypothetical protein
MNFFTNVFVRPILVLEGAKGPSFYNATSGLTITYSSNNTSAHASSDINEPVHFERGFLIDSFSSVPVITHDELAHEYRNLGEALSEMAQLETDGDWGIEKDVQHVAFQVAAELQSMSVPAPQTFTHGPKSVVFNWSTVSENLYLTISTDYISALVSTTEKITKRVDFATNQLLESAQKFRGLLPVPGGGRFVPVSALTSAPQSYLK